MRAVAFGEIDQAGAVEVDAAIMDVIGVLPRMDAAGAEPDLALGVIDAVDAADDPLASGDLVLDRARFPVDQIEVVPAVALGHPDDLAGRRQFFQVKLGIVVDEGGAGFVDDGAGLAGLAVDADQAQGLVAALVEEKNKLLAEGVPVWLADAPRVLEEIVGKRYFFEPIDSKQMRAVNRHSVAWFGIIERVQPRVDLVARRRLDEIDLA